MSTTVIPPANSSGLYAHNNDYGYGYGGGFFPYLYLSHGLLNNNISNAGFANLNATHLAGVGGINATNSGARDILLASNIQNSAFLNSNALNSNAIQANSDRNAIFLNNSVNNLGAANLSSTGAFGMSNLQATERNGSESRLANALTTQNILNSLATHNTAALMGQRDILIENCKANNSLSKQLCDHDARVNANLCNLKSDLQTQSASQFAAIQLEAAKNKCDITQQMSKDHCRIENKIDNLANTTLQGQSALELARIRDDLSKANMELLILKSQPPP